MAEPRVVAILRRSGAWVPASELLDRYCAEGASRWTAYNAVSQAMGKGWIARQGTRGNYSYALSEDVPKEIIDGRESGMRVHGAAKAHEPARQPSGPVFDRLPLVPSIGLVCGDAEVISPEVADIIDGLHRGFYEQFHQVE